MLSATGAMGAMGPVLQGDKEDALGRILDARHPSGALLGADSSQRPSPVESLLRYTSLVKQIHPERCMDSRAQQAFDRASRGYDALCAMDSGFDLTWEDSKSGTASEGRTHWWQSKSLADIQTFLEFRSAALNALYTEIAPNLGAPGMASLDHLNTLIEHAQRTCEHLDRKEGIPRSRFWHVKSRPKRNAQESAMHYVDLLCHLRGMHCFCLLQGKQFVHVADLHAASPLAKLSTLIQQSLQNAKSNEELQQKLAAGNQEDDEVDPLDKFMASLEEEVQHEQAMEPEKRRKCDATDPQNMTEGNGSKGHSEEQLLHGTGKEAEHSAVSAHKGLGKTVHLTAEAADAEKRAAASALLAEEGKACAQRDLQNHLLGELASDDESDADKQWTAILRLGFHAQEGKVTEQIGASCSLPEWFWLILFIPLRLALQSFRIFRNVFFTHLCLVWYE